MGFTFVITVAAVGFLGWLGMRRLVIHFRGNPESTRSFVEHVLVPLFGPKAEELSDPGDARGERGHE
jgi:hypothetical protein